MEKRFTLIVLLVSVLALGTYFFNLKAPTTAAITDEYPLNIIHSSCLLNDDSYNVCVNVNWDAPQNYYVKAQISGGESLSDTPKFYAHEFTYCQNVEKTFVTRVANVYLHSEKGQWVKLIKGYKVDCS